MKEQIQIKLLNDSAKLPTKGTPSAAYYDVIATSITHTERYIEYGLGFSTIIPEGFVGKIYPRSSLSNYDLSIANSVGVVDSDYRGEWKVRFKLAAPNFLYPIGIDTLEYKIYQVGDKIAQIGFEKLTDVEFIKTETFTETERGDSGFGSTGN
jgi:dUTP pyrophosphatase